MNMNTNALLPECVKLAAMRDGMQARWVTMSALEKAAWDKIPPAMIEALHDNAFELCKLAALEVENPELRGLSLEIKRQAAKFIAARDELRTMLEGAAEHMPEGVVLLNGKQIIMHGEHRTLALAYMILVDRHDIEVLLDMLRETTRACMELHLQEGLRMPNFIVEREIEKFLQARM